MMYKHQLEHRDQSIQLGGDFYRIYKENHSHKNIEDLVSIDTFDGNRMEDIILILDQLKHNRIALGFRL